MEWLLFIAELFVPGGSSRRKWNKDAEKGDYLASARVASGSWPRLSSRRYAGTWHVTPGELACEGIRVRVTGIVAGSTRAGDKDEQLMCGEDTTVVTLLTETTEIEWAVLARYFDRAIAALAVPEVSLPG